MSRRIRIIPVLLLKKDGLWKTIKFSNPQYIGDPINAVKIFNEKEVDELVLLDITATKEGRSPKFDRISQIAGEAFMPTAYGGGIRTLDDASRVFDSGFEKVIINTALFEQPQLLGSIAKIYGSQSVVASIDVKKNIFGRSNVKIKSASITTKWSPVEAARLAEKEGAGEILIQSVDRDGTWSGYDIELTRQISNAVSIPVIACGGAGGIEDFNSVVQVGNASAVAAGSLFVFQKKGKGVLINFPQINPYLFQTTSTRD